MREPGVLAEVAAMTVFALSLVFVSLYVGFLIGADQCREMRTDPLALPPCPDCTRGEPRVYANSNENPLAMPRPLGSVGRWPHID